MRKPLQAWMMAMVLTGCATARRVALHDDIAPASTITVEFAEPQTLRGQVDSTEYLVKHVRVVSGRVESVSADTLVIRVHELVTTGRVPYPFRPDRLTIPRDIPTGPSVNRPSESTIRVTVLIAAVGLLYVVYRVKKALDNWLPGPDDDGDAQLAPTSSNRSLPSVGSGGISGLRLASAP